MGSQTLPPRQLQTPSFIFSNVDGDDFSSQPTPRSTPSFVMDRTDTHATGETMNSTATWATPTSKSRKRPATIHEGFSFSIEEDQHELSSWGSPSASLQQTPSDTMSRPASVHQDFCHLQEDNISDETAFSASFLTSMRPEFWYHKGFEENLDLELNSFGADAHVGQAFGADDVIPVLDLEQSSPAQHSESLRQLEGGGNTRRMSGSSFTMSTSGGLSDMPSYDEFSAAMSEARSFCSDYPPPSNRTSLLSSTQLSPVASPRITPQTRPDVVRAQSRGSRVSPSPRPGVRSAPYSVEGSRGKRWSTGSYGTVPSRRISPFVHHPVHDATSLYQQSHANFGMMGSSNFQGSNMLLQGQFSSPCPPQGPTLMAPTLHSQTFRPDISHHLEPPPTLLSHGLFKMLQSNSDALACHGHFGDLSDPPDLFASLHEEQIPPPPEDMDPEDPDMVPHEQELRFEGDLYTPRWVRGHGNKREGWCGICKPGRWLVLKNSAFWYDKSFAHGISAATGNSFQEPRDTRRMDGSPDVWEGLCGSCNDWIALVSNKKKGTTWFRHAYKCHTHQKTRDGAKRRRESSHPKVAAAPLVAKPLVHHQQNMQLELTSTTFGPDAPSVLAPETASGHHGYRGLLVTSSGSPMLGSYDQPMPRGLDHGDTYGNMI